MYATLMQYWSDGPLWFRYVGVCLFLSFCLPFCPFIFRKKERGRKETLTLEEKKNALKADREEGLRGATDGENENEKQQNKDRNTPGISIRAHVQECTGRCHTLSAF